MGLSLKGISLVLGPALSVDLISIYGFMDAGWTN